MDWFLGNIFTGNHGNHGCSHDIFGFLGGSCEFSLKSIDSIGSMNFPIFMDCGLFPPIFFGPTGPTWSKTERLRPAEVGVEANHPTDLSARQDQGAHGGHMGPKSPWLKLNTSMDLL